jgi:hypothetical protein
MHLQRCVYSGSQSEDPRAAAPNYTHVVSLEGGAMQTHFRGAPNKLIPLSLAGGAQPRSAFRDFSADETRRVILRVSQQTERAAQFSIGTNRTSVCATDAEVLVAINGSTTSAGIAWEVSARMARLSAIPNEIVQAAGIPLLLHADIGRTAVEQVVATALRRPDVRVSLQGFNDFHDEVRGLADGAPPSATGAILGRIGAGVDEYVLDIAVAASVAGKRRTTVSAFAKNCGFSSGKIAYRLSAVGLPPARILLGWMVALHAAWRYAVLEWPLKRVAIEGGFTSSVALDHYVRRHIFLQPREYRRSAEVANLLDRFAEMLRAKTWATKHIAQPVSSLNRMSPVSSL